MGVGRPDFKRTLIYGIDFKRTLIYGEGPRFPKSPNLRWGSGRPLPTVDWGSFARIVARMSPQRPPRTSQIDDFGRITQGVASVPIGLFPQTLPVHRPLWAHWPLPVPLVSLLRPCLSLGRFFVKFSTRQALMTTIAKNSSISLSPRPRDPS